MLTFKGQQVGIPPPDMVRTTSMEQTAACRDRRGILRVFKVSATFGIFIFPVGLAQAHEYKAGTIFIGHPWSAPAPAGAKVVAGYLTLRNTGSDADRLVGVTANIAGKSDIHEMKVDADGVMTMRPLQDGVEIPAAGEIKLAPGGLHIMFMDVAKLPKTGDRFKGTLQFEHAGKVDVEFAVETKADADKHASH